VINMGFAYVTHPDLGDQGALIADDPLVIAVQQAKGWVLQDLPDELNPDSSNGPGQVKDQPEVREETNGPGLEALKAQPEPEPESNGPELQDQSESDDQEINGPGGVVAQLIAQAEKDQEEEASRPKRSRKKDQPEPPSGEDQEGSE